MSRFLDVAIGLVLAAPAAARHDPLADLRAAFEARHQALQRARIEVYEEHFDGRGRPFGATLVAATLALPDERYDAVIVDETPSYLVAPDAPPDSWSRAELLRGLGRRTVEIRDGRERLSTGESFGGWRASLVAEHDAQSNYSRRQLLRGVAVLDKWWFAQELARHELVAHESTPERTEWVLARMPRPGGDQAWFVVVTSADAGGRAWLGYETFYASASDVAGVRDGSTPADALRKRWRSVHQVLARTPFRGVELPTHVRAEFPTGSVLEHWIRYAESEPPIGWFDTRAPAGIEGRIALSFTREGTWLDEFPRGDVPERVQAPAATTAPSASPSRTPWLVAAACGLLAIAAIRRLRTPARLAAGALGVLVASLALVAPPASAPATPAAAPSTSPAARAIADTGGVEARRTAVESTVDANRDDPMEVPVVAATARIAGRVVDEHGAPVPHAEIALTGGTREDRQTRAAADALGRFDLGEHRLGAVQELDAHTATHVRTTRTITVGPETADVRLVLARGHAVRLRLVGPLPADHVEVDVTAPGTYHHRFFSAIELAHRADPRDLPLAAFANGTYHFLVRVDGHTVIERAIAIDGELVLDVATAPPARKLAVHVVDADERPLPGGWVRVLGERADEAIEIADPDGVVRLALASDGPRELAVGARGFETAAVTVDEGIEDALVRLEPLARVPVTLFLAHAADATVRIDEADLAVSFRVRGDRATDVPISAAAPGAWSFELPADEVELDVRLSSPRGTASASIRVHASPGTPCALHGLAIDVPAGDAVVLDPRDGRRLDAGPALLLDVAPPVAPVARALGDVVIVADATWEGTLELVSRPDGAPVAPRVVERSPDGAYRIAELEPGWWTATLDGLLISFDASAGARYDLPSRLGASDAARPDPQERRPRSVRYRRPGESLVITALPAPVDADRRLPLLDAPCLWEAAVGDALVASLAPTKGDDIRRFDLDLRRNGAPWRAAVRLWVASDDAVAFLAGTPIRPWRPVDARHGRVVLQGVPGEAMRLRAGAVAGAREVVLVLGAGERIDF